jgi:hypothetical protein
MSVIEMLRQLRQSLGRRRYDRTMGEQARKRRVWMISVASLAGIFIALNASTFVTQAVYAANGEELLLKITVVDPGATADLRKRIAPLKPFECSEMHNGTKITIKGELSAKQKDSYHLRLTLAEWKDQKTNSTEEYDVDLTPDGGGFVSSFIYQRIFLLTHVPKS